MINIFQSMTSSKILIAIPFVLMALFFLWRGIIGQRNATKSKSWATTTGRILSSNLQMRYSHDGNTPYPVITYEYRVLGETHISNRVNHGMEVGGSLYAPRVVKRYPVGQTVEVFYNPENPKESVLEHSAPANNIFILIAVIIVLILVVSFAATFGMMGVFSQGLTPFLNSLGQ